MSESNRAWGYVRLSQTGREASLAEQKTSIREYARESGIHLETTRNDGDRTSGFDNSRDQYQLIREKIREQGIDAVIVRDRARLSRDFDERLALISEFRSRDVEWHVIEAGGLIDVDDIQIAGMECIHAMTDHFKKMIEIERARQATTQRLEKGYDHGRPPFGLTFDDAGEYWLPDEEFEAALDVIQLRENGSSSREIEEETGVNKDRARRVCDRRERYLTEIEGH